MQVVSKEDVKGFLIVQKVMGRVLLSGERLMFLLAEIEPGGVVPEHSHPHEQMGMCLKGKAEFRSGDKTAIVEAGMTYWLSPHEKHGVKLIGDENGVFLDVFSPPREDYLSKQKEATRNI